MNNSAEVLRQPYFSVLLVDDDEVSCESVIRSLRRNNIQCRTVTAEDGQDALDIVRGKHPHKSIEEPYLVLLDLNMPRMDGFEFLEAVRGDAALREMVVFVLTTSGRDTDRSRAYSENVAGYMVKSHVGPQFSLLASFIDKYAQAVHLP